MKKLALIALIILSASSAAGDWTVSAYRTFKTDRELWDLARIHIRGVGTGYSWANLYLKRAGQGQLFCPPQKKAPKDDDYIDILDREIQRRARKDKEIEERYIEKLLMDGLKRTFPCTKSSESVREK